MAGSSEDRLEQDQAFPSCSSHQGSIEPRQRIKDSPTPDIGDFPNKKLRLADKWRTPRQPSNDSCLGRLKLMTLVLLTLRLTFTNRVEARANEVEIDWAISSHLFSKGDQITTKYIRMKDILHFRCPPFISFNIHMVPAESAMFCRLPNPDDHSTTPSTAQRAQILRAPIGRCAPNTGHPKVNVRPFSPLPDRPVFQEGQSYFLITTSTGTPDGIDNKEGGLCSSHGMRLRLVVLGGSSGGVLNAGNNRAGDEEVGRLEDIFNQLNPSAQLSGTSKPVPLAPGQAAPKISEPISTTFAPSEDDKIPNRSKPFLPDQHLPPVTTTTTSPSPPQHRGRHVHGAELNGRQVEGEGGFPAILTLEENGRRKKILVHNPKQLQQEINYANERNSRVQQLEVFKSSEADQANGGSLRSINLPEYSISGQGKIEAIPAKLSPTSTINSGSGSFGTGLGRREASNGHHVQGRGGVEQGGDPQVQSAAMQHQQPPFIYVVGYNEDGTENQHSPSKASATASSPSPMLLLLICCCSIVPTLGAILTYIFIRRS